MSVLTIAAIGVLCLVSAPLPIVRDLEPNILPLAWLKWIGWSLLGVSGLQLLYSVLWHRPYHYIRYGTPAVGRVISIERIPVGNKNVPGFRYAVEVDYENPDTCQRQQSVIKSRDSWSQWWANGISLELSPGDEITLIGITGRYADTVRIYGFLGLNPDCELIRYRGKPLQGMSPWNAVMVVLACIGVCWLLLIFFEAILYGQPYNQTDDWSDWPMVLGLAVPGCVVGISVVYWLRHRFLRGESRKPNRIRGYLSGALVGIAFSLLGFAALNARLDHRAGRFYPVTVLGFRHWTHAMMIRTYEAEFKVIDSPQASSTWIRYPQLVALGHAQYAGLEVAPGRFGIPWMRGIHPAIWIPVTEASEISGPIYRASVQVENQQAPEGANETDVQTVDLKPVFWLGKRQYAPISPALIDLLLDELRVTHPEVQQIELVN